MGVIIGLRRKGVANNGEKGRGKEDEERKVK